MNYENIKSTTQDRVVIVTLDRHDAFNALSDDIMRELADAITELSLEAERHLLLVPTSRAWVTAPTWTPTSVNSSADTGMA